MTRFALIVTFLTLASFNAAAQTNAAKTSTVGTWKADLAKSSWTSGPAPKALTLTILKDTPEVTSWRVDIVDPKGDATSFSWSGPPNGSLQPLKDPKGTVLIQESLKLDKDGALLRHGSDSTATFDGRATLSADGNTITDVTTIKMKDGKTFTDTTVYRRVAVGKK
jgi:hypothetical protein